MSVSVCVSLLLSFSALSHIVLILITKYTYMYNNERNIWRILKSQRRAAASDNDDDDDMMENRHTFLIFCNFYCLSQPSHRATFCAIY